jgi:hypothetical protein
LYSLVAYLKKKKKFNLIKRDNTTIVFITTIVIINKKVLLLLSFNCLNEVSFFIVVFKNIVLMVKCDGLIVLLNIISISLNVLADILLVVTFDTFSYGLLLILLNGINVFFLEVKSFFNIYIFRLVDDVLVVVEFIFLVKFMVALFAFLF